MEARTEIIKAGSTLGSTVHIEATILGEETDSAFTLPSFTLITNEIENITNSLLTIVQQAQAPRVSVEFSFEFTLRTNQPSKMRAQGIGTRLSASSDTQEIEHFLQNSTVRLSSTEGRILGTGFFIAPGQIMTCAHIVQGTQAENAPIRVDWDGRAHQAQVTLSLTELDLALLKIDQTEHPCVSLHEEVKPSTNLLSYAYSSDYPDGNSVSFVYEGFSDERYLILRDGAPRPGFGGAPLLNPETGRVCGFIQDSGDRTYHASVRAIWMKTVLEALEDQRHKLQSQDRQRRDAQVETEQVEREISMVEPVLLNIAIGSLVKSAPGWSDSLQTFLVGEGKDIAFDQAKQQVANFFDKKTHERHMELALQNAAERGLAKFHTSEERDRYRDILSLLSESGNHNEELRSEAMRLFTLSDPPDFSSLTEKYNLSQRISSIAHQQTHEEVDATPYLSSFFEALIAELYNDPLFHDQMSDVIRVRAALQGQRSLEEIVAILRQISGILESGYTAEQFQADVRTYVEHVEALYHFHSIVGVTLQGGEDTRPELDAIFVPLHISLQDSTTPQMYAPDELIPLLEQAPYLVLLGGPGFGKSTTTRYLAWRHAAANIAGASVPASKKAVVLRGEPVPLRIELGPFVEAQKQHPYSFLSYTTEVLLAREGISSIKAQMFEELLKRRLMLLLFDGLDEVPTLDERRLLIDQIEQFALRFPGNRIVVTSRPVGYELASFSSQWFKHGMVQEFNDEQIYRFLEGFYTYVLRYPQFSSEARDELGIFYKSLKDTPGIYNLARNPLLLTVTTALFHSERLPEKRVQLYERCADLLLNTWAKLRSTDARWKDVRMSKNDQRACLAHIGFVLHEKSQERENDETEAVEGILQSTEDSATDVSASFIVREIVRFLENQNLNFSVDGQRAEAERFLELVKEEAGLIVERGIDEQGEPLYGFVHRTFQEYFAAVDVYERYLEEEDRSIISEFLEKHLHDPHWREVIFLLFDKLRRKSASFFLRQILGGEIKSRYSEDTNLTQALFFASNCLSEDTPVVDDLAVTVVAQLGNLVKSSPLPSMRIQALKALVSLIRTEEYANLGRDALRELVTAAEAPANLEAAQALLQDSPQNSEEWQLSFDAIARLVQQANLPFKRAIQAIQMLCQISPVGSEQQQQAIQMLLQLTQTSDLPIEQTILVAKVLYEVAPAGSVEQQQATQLLLNILERSDLSVKQMIQAAQALYQSSPVSSPEQQQATRVLLALTQRSDLPIEQIISAGQALYRSSPAQSREQQQATQMLIQLIQRPDLSIEQVTQASQALYQASLPGSDEQQFAAQLLASLVQRPDLTPEQIILVAQALYQSNPASSAEHQLATQALLERVKWPGISVEQTRLVIQTIYKYLSPASREWQVITNQIVQSLKLSVDEIIQLAAVQAEEDDQIYLTAKIRQTLQLQQVVPTYSWYLSLEVPGEQATLQVGQSLTLTLRLFPIAHHNRHLLRLPLDALELAVYLQAPGFHLLGEHTRSLPVVEGRPVERALTVQLIAVASGEQNVRLLVYPGGRREGLLPVTLSRTFSVQAPVRLPEIPELLERHAIPHPYPKVLLYLSILEQQGHQQLQLFLTCPLLGLDREALEPPLPFTPADLTELRQAAAQLGTETGEAAPVDVLASLRAFGTRLFDLLMPPGQRLRALYWQLRSLISDQADPWSWLVVADERAVLPWELVCPYRHLPSGEVWYDAFLAEQFVLAHWIGRQGLTLRAEAPLGSLALDHYHQRPQDLPYWHATLEDEEPGGDGDTDGATALPGHLALMRPSSPYYGLHILRYTDVERSTRITSAEGQDAVVFSTEVETMLYRQRLDFTLRRPVLGLSLLNGQESGLGVPLGQRETHLEESWALPFLHAGVSALVGPHWPVTEEVDRHFFRAFYAAIRSGAPLGWAVWEARLQVRLLFPKRADWLAYSYFGHPWCQPYAVQAAQGFTLFEALDHQEGTPFEAGQSYRFRASYRVEAPLWYSGRVRRSQELPSTEDISVLVAPLIGVEPTIYPLQRMSGGEDYQCVVTLIMPQEETTLPVLIRFHKGEDELRSLTLKLKVRRETKGEIGLLRTGGV